MEMSAEVLENLVEVSPDSTIAETAIEFARRELNRFDDPSEIQVHVVDRESDTRYPIRVVRRVVYEARGLRGELCRESNLGEVSPVQTGDLVTATGSKHYWEDTSKDFDHEYKTIDSNLDKSLLFVVIMFLVFVLVMLSLANGR